MWTAEIIRDRRMGLATARIQCHLWHSALIYCTSSFELGCAVRLCSDAKTHASLKLTFGLIPQLLTRLDLKPVPSHTCVEFICRPANATLTPDCLELLSMGDGTPQARPGRICNFAASTPCCPYLSLLRSHCLAPCSAVHSLHLCCSSMNSRSSHLHVGSGIS